jgi:hypothetical protein
VEFGPWQIKISLSLVRHERSRCGGVFQLVLYISVCRNADCRARPDSSYIVSFAVSHDECAKDRIGERIVEGLEDVEDLSFATATPFCRS